MAFRQGPLEYGPYCHLSFAVPVPWTFRTGRKASLSSLFKNLNEIQYMQNAWSLSMSYLSVPVVVFIMSRCGHLFWLLDTSCLKPLCTKQLNLPLELWLLFLWQVSKVQ